MRIFLAFFTLLFGIINLCEAQTQFELDSTAGVEYHKADKELNDMYKKILTEYSTDTAFIKNLKIDERIWLKFRDAELKIKYPDEPDGYGSVEPMCEAYYLAQLTEDRIKTLKEWVNGEEEGDVCGGSVKMKN